MPFPTIISLHLENKRSAFAGSAGVPPANEPKASRFAFALRSTSFRCALIAGGTPALPASRWQMHTPEQVCKSRIRAQRIVNRIRFDLSHSIRALFKGLVQPDERLVFV